ncbi:hypothetical protein ACFQZE_07000 [Paenibacillus sp. GCM10027627]
MGIVVGIWDEQQEEFTNCIVSSEAMGKLDPYWSYYYWWLHKQDN